MGMNSITSTKRNVVIKSAVQNVGNWFRAINNMYNKIKQSIKETMILTVAKLIGIKRAIALYKSLRDLRPEQETKLVLLFTMKKGLNAANE